MYDISSGQLLESVDAHDGPVWSLSLASDKVQYYIQTCNAGQAKRDIARIVSKY